MTMELKLLLWTLVLAGVQILLAAALRASEVGFPYAAGPRDKPSPKPERIITGRMLRAQKNLFETLPIFIGLVIVAQILGVHSSLTTNGAMLYFWGRVIYLPLYATGVPYVRTVVWVASAAGLVMLMVALLCPA